MTIKTRAFLRGYLGEKTAGWFSRGARKRKAVREKRYTDQFNKEINALVNPTEEYPGYETPSAHTAALIAKGQAEAKRHREAGTTPQQNEWNRENWRTLFQPKAKGTSIPAPTQTEIQEARDAIGKPAPAPIIKKRKAPQTTEDYEKTWKSRGF